MEAKNENLEETADNESADARLFRNTCLARAGISLIGLIAVVDGFARRAQSSEDWRYFGLGAGFVTAAVATYYGILYGAKKLYSKYRIRRKENGNKK